MARYVLIRDDDINFFTTPEMLEMIYAEVFKMGVPVNYSVIPFVSTNIKTFYPNTERRLRCELFVPMEFQGRGLFMPFHRNFELIEFTKNMQNYIEIIQHGFSHSPNEFSSLNDVELKKKILSGKQILEKSFGSAPIFFSAPYDAYSPISLVLLQKHFHGATYGEFKLDRHGIRNLPVTMIPRFIAAVQRGDNYLVTQNFLLLGHKGTYIDSLLDDERALHSLKESFSNGSKIIMLMQHYWNYFYSEHEGIVKDTINTRLRDMFIEMVQWLKDERARFVTFSQLYRMLVGAL